MVKSNFATKFIIHNLGSLDVKLNQNVCWDPTYLARIGENDLIAMEIKYHANCLDSGIIKNKKNKGATLYWILQMYGPNTHLPKFIHQKPPTKSF